MSEDAEYREAFVLAQEEAADRLEDEAFRRAVEGVEKPVGWYKGKPGGVIREYSDVLLIFLLKGARPEKYADRVQNRWELSQRVDLAGTVLDYAKGTFDPLDLLAY